MFRPLYILFWLRQYHFYQYLHSGKVFYSALIYLNCTFAKMRTICTFYVFHTTLVAPFWHRAWRFHVCCVAIIMWNAPYEKHYTCGKTYWHQNVFFINWTTLKEKNTVTYVLHAWTQIVHLPLELKHEYRENDHSELEWTEREFLSTWAI